MPPSQEAESGAEGTAVTAQQQAVLQTSSAADNHDQLLLVARSDSDLDYVLDQRFYFAVSLSASAVLLPIVSSLLNPIARDCLTSLDAAIWLLSAIFIFYRNHYHSRSRLFRNGVLAAFIYGLLVSKFNTALPDAYSFLPLAVNVAIVVNAQDIPLTWTWPWIWRRSRRSHSDVLPFHNHGNGSVMQ